MRGTIPRDLYGGTSHSISHKITDSEVSVEGEVGTDESKTAGYLCFIAILGGVHAAEVVGDTFSFAIGGSGEDRIGCTEIIFGDVCQLTRLGAIDGTGACEEEFLNAGVFGEFEDVLGALHDDIEHFVRCGVVQMGAGRGCGVHQVLERFSGKLKIAHVALQKLEAWLGCQVRGFGGEGCGATGQDGGRHPEIEALVDVAEGLEQPHSKEAGAAGDEKGSSLGLVPAMSGVVEHVI